MAVLIQRNDTQFEVFETFNVILKDNEIATIISEKHDFKVMFVFQNDDSKKRALNYKFSEEHDCPFLYFTNWASQTMATREILPIAEVTKTEIATDDSTETSTRGRLGLQIFVNRTTEIININLQFLFEPFNEVNTED